MGVEMAVEMRIASCQVSQVGLLGSSGGAVLENFWRSFKLIWPWTEIGTFVGVPIVVRKVSRHDAPAL